MRVSEVLNLTPNDVDGRRLIIRDSKGGRGEEVVFIPPKLAARLKEYISEKGIEPGLIHNQSKLSEILVPASITAKVNITSLNSHF
jgi:integrase